MEDQSQGASRRTHLAEERTLLAWWRSGLASLAVAIGVGRLLPALLDDGGRGAFAALGIAYAVLGLALVVLGSIRERAQSRALSEGRFVPLSGIVVVAVSGYLALLALATIALVLFV